MPDTPGKCRPAATLRIWSPVGCTLKQCGDADAEEAQALEPVVAWQPNGRHIYCSQAMGQRRRMCLFERNGLGHGSFLVKEDEDFHIQDATWSPDSAILALAASCGVRTCERLSSPTLPIQPVQRWRWTMPCFQRHVCPHPLVMHHAHSAACLSCAGQHGTASLHACEHDQFVRLQEGMWAVQLWQRRNWHWYQIVERRWTGGPVHIAWTGATTQTLLVLSSSGRLEHWGLSMAAAVSERGTAAVIDGSSVLLTPFRHALVPPPLCAARVSLPVPAQAVAWGQTSGCECLAIAHAAGLCVVRCVEADLWEETAEEVAGRDLKAPADGVGDGATIAAHQLQLPDCVDSHSVHACTHACWMSGGLLALVVPARSHAYGSEGDAVVALTLQWAEDGTAVVRRCVGVCVGAAVIAVATVGDGAMLVQLASAELLRVSLGEQDLAVAPAGRCAEPCRHMFVHSPAAGSGGAARVVTVYGISALGKLCAGDEVIATDVSSACLRSWGPGGSHLLFTTNSRVLYTLALEGGARPLQAVAAPGGHAAAKWAAPAASKGGVTKAMRPEASQLQTAGVVARAVEAGAQLVAAPAGSSMAVLQMPRGNLEGVHVRALTLASVTERLMHGEFGVAMAEAAAHRVDLNLLVDFRWPAFLQQAAEFVRQVAPGDVCDMLAALRPDNCLAEGERYGGALPAAMQEAHACAACEPAEDQGSGETDWAAGDKVNSVCAAVREHSLRLGGKYAQPAVMSYVRCGPDRRWHGASDPVVPCCAHVSVDVVGSAWSTLVRVWRSAATR